MNKKTALLVGASGLVGQQLLHLLLDTSQYEKVVVLVRKQLDISHPKLEQRITDFDDIDLQGLAVNHVFCTLGTTIKKAGSKAAFRKVDEEYPLSVAKKCHKSGTELFAIVTAMGANSKSSIFYNQVKGNLESDLQNIGYQHLAVFRPSMLEGERTEKRFGEQIGSIFMKGLNFLIPDNYKLIHVKKVAKAMLLYAEKPKKGFSIILSGEML